MPIAKITGQGLIAIAISVALLWGCLVSERLIVNRANEEASRSLRDLRLMRQQRHAIPVSVPVPHQSPVHPVAG